MTDKNAIRLLAYSFYPLALGIFVSVSLIPLYQILIFAIFLAFAFQKKISSSSIPYSSWALLAFVCLQLVSSLLNSAGFHDPVRSLGTLKYPIIGIFSTLLFKDFRFQNNTYLKKHASQALHIFLFTIILAFSYSLVKVYSGLDYFKDYYQSIADGNESIRFSGFSETMRYGYGTALTILILFACFLNFEKIKFFSKWLLVSSIVTGFAGMYLSYTRGSLIAILLCTPVIFFFYNRKAALWTGLGSFLIITTMITVSLRGGLENSSQIKSESMRFLQKSDSNSNKVRIAQYWAAYHLTKEKPVFGFGPSQFKYHAKEVKIKNNLGYTDFDSHAHNVYLQIAADSGILGLTAFLFWIFFWLKETLQFGNNFAKQVFLPTILFLLVAGQFEMLFMAQTSTLIYFIYALSGLNIFKKETA